MGGRAAGLGPLPGGGGACPSAPAAAQCGPPDAADADAADAAPRTEGGPRDPGLGPPLHSMPSCGPRPPGSASARRPAGRPPLLLVLDNGSEFTPEIAAALAADGAPFESRAADDPAAWDAALRADSYVLSGRRRNDRAMNVLNSRIVRLAVSRGRPLLGICYGAEVLALAAGGTIRRMDRADRGAGRVEIVRDSPLCPAGSTISVREQHRYEIARLGRRGLESIGRSGRCSNELVRLGRTHVYGAQFHPEMTADGRMLLGRFARLKGY